MIDIEQARLEDLDELVRLFEAYRAFYRCELDAVAARAYLGARLRNGESTVFLAWQNGDAGRRAVGFTQLYPCWASLRPPSWILYDLYVDASARRSGVAQPCSAPSRTHARPARVSSRLKRCRQHLPQALYESTGWKRDSILRTTTISEQAYRDSARASQWVPETAGAMVITSVSRQPTSAAACWIGVVSCTTRVSSSNRADHGFASVKRTP